MTNHVSSVTLVCETFLVKLKKKKKRLRDAHLLTLFARFSLHVRFQKFGDYL